MKYRMRAITAVMAVAVPLTLLSAGAAGATNVGTEGCTPGYWKNHTENWEEYRPTFQLRYIFKGLPADSKYRTVTLRDALSLRGGPGVDGATQILLRAASAGILNAAHEGLGYPYRRFTGEFSLMTQVNAALASGDRARMLKLATTLDDANNLGCPLN